MRAEPPLCGCGAGDRPLEPVGGGHLPGRAERFQLARRQGRGRVPVVAQPGVIAHVTHARVCVCVDVAFGRGLLN